uniref:Uncharacterized protein n=1 Tax=Moniliophthora roreri TaxID=221103 RepID=A0A0W0GAB0_MONRR
MPQYGPMHQTTFQRLWEFMSQYGNFIEAICWSFLSKTYLSGMLNNEHIIRNKNSTS